MTASLRSARWRYVRPLVLLPALSLSTGATLLAAPRPASYPTAVLADITITGQVLDEKGQGLPGVNVIVKGTSNGVQTNASGAYRIVAPANATLIFSFVGYLASEVAVDGRTTVNTSLRADAQSLNEVVVVGYGAQERKLLATSISTISARNVELVPVATPSEALVGLVAGAQITEPTGEPGAPATIRIRGLGSISAGNSPLYVVDGYPLNSSDSFSQIPPTDIESIQVLKDAAACAIYGSRGGNGIIIVTTKHGVVGKTKFAANVYTGFQTVSKRVDVLNGPQYLDYLKEGFANANRTIPAALLADPSTYANTDWQDEIFRTGIQSNYQVSASGGSDKTRFYVSGGYFKQKGIVEGTGFDRFSLRANYDAQLSDKVKLTVNFAPSFSRTDTKPLSGNFNNATISGGGPSNVPAAITSALIAPPIFPVRIANGDYSLTTNALGGNAISSGLFNAVAPLDLYQDRTNLARGLGNVALDYVIFKGLTFRTNAGAELLNSRRAWYIPATLPTNAQARANLSNPILANIDARQLNSTNYNWLWENTLTYNHTFATDHNLTLLAGYSAQRNTLEGSNVFGQSGTYTNTAIDYATAAGQLFGSASYTANSLSSAFGRLDYAFKERYIITAALRTDGSSRFGPDNRYATFPSVALAWRAGEENFIKRFPVISELKVRGSFGVTGNNNIGDYTYQSYQTAANYVFGANTGARVFGFAPNGVNVRDLTWETNTQYDAGFDLGFFHDRIYLTAAAYQRNTTNLLLNRNVPAVIGYTTRTFGNVGEVRNRGLEFQLNTANLVGHGFTWSTSANISVNRNQVMALSGATDQILYDAVFGYTSSIRVVPGQPLGAYYGYEQIGVYKDQADVDASAKWASGGSAPGDLKFKDINGDGVIDSKDITQIGNPFPKFTYGMVNTFGYKNFSLSVTIQGSQGNDILYAGDRYVNNFPAQANARTNVLGRWHSPTDPGNGWEPRVTSTAPSSLTSFSSHYVFDGSFLRVRTVNLRYALPEAIVGKVGLASASVYAAAQNLFTFTSYFGYNPEANLYGNTTAPTYGVDQGSYPMARTVTLGVTIGF
ncbi:SusC/RagA family TonB-linked outer membrane protein [Hymenobacter sp. HMF4947]|uniref:SusC/RagA family TonB-linked outer membrane protein n=1 Tax=Hymenobacter ginkgonis TaxID=2682976 RepID=A0A7K1T990_9BACT|nr:TonB-dependent receptor [Hymenobacter ginkgonis]MVN74963.1 SusC/RagA family TonB-linked outer membrane protein [Hymenobacter ginkgonis]